MCLSCDTKLAAQNLEEFSARYLEILNHGALTLMISVGHRTGLFDALRAIAPCTSDQLTAASGLNERYVREWLGAMTTGGIVGCSAKSRRGSWSVFIRGAVCLTALTRAFMM